MLLHPRRFCKAGIGRDYARRAYSYVEFVIVIMIMIILGLIAMPLVHTDIGPRKVPRKYLIMREDMARVQSAIDQYFLDHKYTYPAYHDVDGKWYAENDTYEEQVFLKQMYGWTDINGKVAGPSDSREDFPYGPYLQGEFPTNPIMGNNRIKCWGGSAWNDVSEGWLFDREKGRFIFGGTDDLYATEGHDVWTVMRKWNND